MGDVGCAYELKLFVFYLLHSGPFVPRCHASRLASDKDGKGSLSSIGHVYCMISKPPYQVASTTLGFLSVPGGSSTHPGLPFNQEFGDFILDERARIRRFGGSLGK
jgi:hypothetical protein